MYLELQVLQGALSGGTGSEWRQPRWCRYKHFFSLQAHWPLTVTHTHTHTQCVFVWSKTHKALTACLLLLRLLFHYSMNNGWMNGSSTQANQILMVLDGCNTNYKQSFRKVRGKVKQRFSTKQIHASSKTYENYSIWIQTMMNSRKSKNIKRKCNNLNKWLVYQNRAESISHISMINWLSK